ncbi:MAG: hypothetical protein H0T15_07515, partial [Thermoleophilaceae bacterium]|nr:hypothetical protein [Thermoleophilaceae bacterium]
MNKRLLIALVAAALAAVALLSALTLPAGAELRTITVRLGDGTLIQVQVDVPPGTPLEDIDIPILPQPAPAPPPTAPAPAPA